MTYLRYDLQTGEILATIQASPSNVDALEVEGAGLIEGDANALDYWIEHGEIRKREAADVPVAPIPFMPSDT